MYFPLNYLKELVRVMKKVISISLGSSSRDHRVETDILGEHFIIERRGTDGDKEEARYLFNQLDGKYDAFGLGGIDLYIYSAGKRYTFRDAKKLIKNIKKTPVVDGSGLKNTLERRVITYVAENLGMNLKDKKVLMVSALDRFGMAESFVDFNSDITFGDLIFALNLPLPIRSVNILEKVAKLILPVVTKLPFELFYPTGDKQDKENTKHRYEKYYQEADIIAGDYHYIKKYMPKKMDNKIIITNTVTDKDVQVLRRRGVEKLITTTPELNGRSFGTNVMEGVLVAIAEKQPENLTTDDYMSLLDKMNFTPRVVDFNKNLAS